MSSLIDVDSKLSHLYYSSKAYHVWAHTMEAKFLLERGSIDYEFHQVNTFFFVL